MDMSTYFDKKFKYEYYTSQLAQVEVRLMALKRDLKADEEARTIIYEHLTEEKEHLKQIIKNLKLEF